MKREMKLAEWTRLIQQRTESGKSIKAWCDEQGIRRRLYYYWQKRVREATIKNAAMIYPGALVAQITAGGALPTIQTEMAEFAKIEIKNPGSHVAMNIRFGIAECEIYNGADIDIVERAILTLGKI